MSSYTLLSGKDIDKLPSFLEHAKNLSLPEQLDIIRNIIVVYCPDYMHSTPVEQYLKLIDHMKAHAVRNP